VIILSVAIRGSIDRRTSRIVSSTRLIAIVS
jgi:hypothetical protein